MSTVYVVENIACILLPCGSVSRIDLADVEFARSLNWRVRRGYVQGRQTVARDGLKKRVVVHLHRALLGAADGQVVDHIDGDKLNNTRANLRFASPRENMWNMRKPRSNTSGFKGVSSRRGKWRASIRLKTGRVFLGDYESARDAAVAYDCAARENFGDFACLNFPELAAEPPQRTRRMGRDQVAEIRRMHMRGLSDRQIAEQTGHSQGNVNNITSGRSWKSLPWPTPPEQTP